jgi:hypothetical protein
MTGIPLAFITTAGNVPDVKAAADLVDAAGPVAGRVGHPRRRPDTILANGGQFREWLRARRIASVIPQRGHKKIIGLGKIRWMVEKGDRSPPPVQAFSPSGWDRHLFMHQDPEAPLARGLAAPLARQ